jgi:DNA-binding transcriptional regulator/RsmH inhibitor MraZ
LKAVIWGGQGQGLRFVGVYEAKVDKVGRLTVPRDVREVLEAGDPGAKARAADAARGDAGKVRLVLAWGDTRFPYVTGYTFEGHQNIAEALDALDPDDPRVAELTSKLIEKSETIRVDEDGRCVLGKRLRERLGFIDADGTPGEGMVVFAGRGSYLRLWPQAAYEAAEAAEGAATAAEATVLRPGEDPVQALKRRPRG